jgi:hypothetical protein
MEKVTMVKGGAFTLGKVGYEKRIRASKEMRYYRIGMGLRSLLPTDFFDGEL